MKKTFSVLFVCTGNTCRSPLAEAILKSELRKAGIAHVAVSSAGTGACAGGPASHDAGAVARQIGLSLSSFKTKPLTGRRVARADLILTMGASHREEIDRRWPEAGSKTYVLPDFSCSGRSAIQDPMGKPMAAYARCADVLQDEIRQALPRITRLLKRRKSRTRP